MIQNQKMKYKKVFIGIRTYNKGMMREGKGGHTITSLLFHHSQNLYRELYYKICNHYKVITLACQKWVGLAGFESASWIQRIHMLSKLHYSPINKKIGGDGI